MESYQFTYSYTVISGPFDDIYLKMTKILSHVTVRKQAELVCCGNFIVRLAESI